MDISATLLRQVNKSSIKSLFLLITVALASIMLITLGVSFFSGISPVELAMNEKAEENKFSVRLLHPSAIESLTQNQKAEILQTLQQNLTFLQDEATDSELQEMATKANEEWEAYHRKFIKNNGLDSEARTDFVNLSTSFDSLASETSETLTRSSGRMVRNVMISMLFLLAVLLCGYLLLNDKVIRPALKLARLSKEAAAGKLEEDINVGARNEIESIAKSVNSLTYTLNNADAFTREIGNGNLDVAYPGIDASDEEINHLTASLLYMRDKMKTAAEDERQRSWITEGLARFSEILRKNNSNLESMADIVISNLVKYLEGNQGGFFVVDNESHEEPVLKLRATYAYDRKKFISKTVEKGQGLVGQAYVEQEAIYLTKIPQDYIDIRSGLGDSGPRSLLIVPLKVNGEIHGVIEIASFNEIPAYRREFAEKVGETIASTISTVKINEQTSHLYRESQEMTEQLRAQEEEMRQNMEEMQATQEEMRRAQQELTRKEANLSALINNTTDSIVTVDREYKIMVINKVLSDRYKGTNYEGMGAGKNVLDYLGDVREEWKGYYDRALAGERLQFTIKSSVSGEDSYREYNIHPIKVGTGEIAGASVFSRDVTEQKLTEIKSKEVMRELKHKDRLFLSSFYFLELNHQFEITRANEHFSRMVGLSETEITGSHIRTFLPDQDTTFIEVLSSMNSEKLWDGEIRFKANDGEIKDLQAHATFIDDEDDRLDKYVLVMTLASIKSV